MPSLSSSAIARAAYDDVSRILDLWYRDGDRYSYFDVPGAVYEALLAAPSAGRFVNDQIKGRFRFEIEPRRRRFRPHEEGGSGLN
ncbi:KTSC domain-containing protein [Allosphingosinicella vermicomposti]|uniref:KTSC domain-containing protein n=1 Tax=Allosphingosinicella vermicomposti TaxID=614671 RepID=UPI000D0E514F|nr:KTSC domain-containing protein [Allosphingosinicella vermicomposti]